MEAVLELVTVEEIFEKPPNERYELVRGEVIILSPAGFEHGEISANISAILHHFVKKNRHGVVTGAETGFILAHNPDTVRGADAAFVSAERVAQQKNREKFFDGPPDLAVEVVSPNDKDVEVEEKILEYLQAGTRLLWIVYPRTKSIYVYRSLKNVQILTHEDVLDGYDVLPGFSIPIREIFE